MLFKGIALAVCVTASAVVVADDTPTATPTPTTTTRPEVRTPDAEEREQLEATLRRIDEEDQRYRGQLQWETTDLEEIERLNQMEIEEVFAELHRRREAGIKLDPEVRAELSEKQIEFDRRLFEEVVELTKRYGFPDPERLGLEAPSVVPVLIHARLEAWEAHQGLFRAEAEAGRMKGREFAVVYDRKLQHAGKVQLYGTSSRFNPETGKADPPEIEDIEQTDAARAAIEMEPLEDYLIVSPKE